MAYLDHAATTPMVPEAREAWLRESDLVGNAMSLHASGRAARAVLEEARESVAADTGARPSEVIFTGGGTEADNLAIQGFVRAALARGVERPRLIISAIEHHAVLDPAQWLADAGAVDLDLVPVDVRGRIDVAVLEELVARDPQRVAAISVMWANNEVGTIQPVAEVSAIGRAHRIPVHSDAVQAVAVVPVTAGAVDALTVSGHKIGGPHGVGALVVSRDVRLSPLMLGGGQERDPRPGTPDVASVAAFAAALRVAVQRREWLAAHVRALRDELESEVRRIVPGVIVNGCVEDRLPGTSHLTFPGCEGDALLMLLDAAGVECSTGSACTAGIPEASHVLLAMGVDELTARGSLRFSVGATSTREDVAALLAVLPGVVERAMRAGHLRRRPS